MFGNFREFPLLEVIGLTERKTGVLLVRDAVETQLVAELERGTLRSLICNGEAIVHTDRVRALLLALARAANADFEFHPGPLANPGVLNLPLRGLLEPMTAARVNPALLPDPATRFVLAGQDFAGLQSELREFARLNRLWLLDGASAHELAVTNQHPLAAVQEALHQLRLAGIVRPQRRLDQPRPEQPRPEQLRSVQPRVEAPEPRPSLVSRLLGALRLQRGRA